MDEISQRLEKLSARVDELAGARISFSKELTLLGNSFSTVTFSIQAIARRLAVVEEFCNGTGSSHCASDDRTADDDDHDDDSLASDSDSQDPAPDDDGSGHGDSARPDLRGGSVAASCNGTNVVYTLGVGATDSTDACAPVYSTLLPNVPVTDSFVTLYCAQPHTLPQDLLASPLQ